MGYYEQGFSKSTTYLKVYVLLVCVCVCMCAAINEPIHPLTDIDKTSKATRLQN